MNTRQKYTQQMITRVYEFGKRNADVFPKKSAAGELLESLRQDILDLDAHSSQQISGNGSIRTSQVSRVSAHKDLQFRLERMSQTARALKLEKFYMPRNHSDEALIDSGEAFAQDAEPFKQDFIKQGFPTSFMDDLKTAVQQLRSAKLEKDAGMAKRKATTASFDTKMKKALDDLTRFEALVAVTLSHSPVLMAEWDHARRVGRPPARRKQPAVTSQSPQSEAAPAGT